MNGGKKFDICMMNPPYGGGIGEKFFKRVLQLSNKCITIQPTTWLLGKKQNKNIINEIKDKKCDITIINPKDFDASFLSTVSINYIDNTSDKEIVVHNDLLNKTFVYDNIQDVTDLSFDKLLTKFNDIVKPLYNHDSLENHYIKTWEIDKTELIKQDLPCIRFAGIRGHFISADGKINPDFYTILSNNQSEIKNKAYVNSSKIKDKDMNLIILQSEDERIGLVNYIMSDFCRACLRIIKNNQHLDRGELQYIPWFDFSQDIFSKSPREIDDYLFNKYKISDEIRNHIEEILPDYYNIRS